MDSYTAATEQFEKWLVQEGIEVLPKVKIEDLRKAFQGRGMVAIEDIDQDEVLFSVPRSATIYIENCSLIQDRPELKEKLCRLNQWELLIVILLYEIHVKGGKSKWSPYFDMLPVKETAQYTFNQLIFWTEEELSLLKPSLILDRVGKDLAEILFKKLSPGIIVDNLGIQELALVTRDDYFKVATLIKLYSFDVDKLLRLPKDDEDEEEEEEEKEEHESKEADHKDSNEGKNSVDSFSLPIEPMVIDDDYFKTMVPLADILNADTHLHNTSLTYSGNKLAMVSVKPIKKGEQIYNTYSDHPNSEILRRYGYVETEGLKYDFGEIPIANIRKHFAEVGNMPISEVEDVLRMLNVAMLKEEENGSEYVELVLDLYDCFRTREVLMELIFVIQFLTIICIIHKINSIELLASEAKFQLVDRIFKKCYQLMESRKLTKQFKQNYQAILDNRLSEYPLFAAEPFAKGYPQNREEIAHVVLKSEYQALANCSDSEMIFDTLGKYTFIDDGKLIRNIIKKNFAVDLNLDDEPTTKKRKI